MKKIVYTEFMLQTLANIAQIGGEWRNRSLCWAMKVLRATPSQSWAPQVDKDMYIYLGIFRTIWIAARVVGT